MEPKINTRVNDILQENNAERAFHAKGERTSGRDFGSTSFEMRKQSKQFAVHKEPSLTSEKVISKNLMESTKMRSNGEYGMTNDAFISNRDFQGYMETVPEIRRHSRVSGKNSEKTDESIVNQSNYRVNINPDDTFGKPSKYSLSDKKESRLS